MPVQMWERPTAPCLVCNEEITDLHYAECSACFKMFHLRMTENAPDAKDCGIVEMDNEGYGMIFTCLTCYEEAMAEEEEEQPLRRSF